MDSARLKQIEEIYHSAQDVDEAERELFLDEYCGDDEELRHEVESLLRYDGTSDDFIDTADSLAAEMLSENDEQSSLTNETIGHYTIRQRIGAGGMGEVYLADDTKLNRKVALKILHKDIASDVSRLRRFEQEAQAASALNHPNILTVHEFGTVEDIHYLATEYIEGETLRQAIGSGELTLMDSLTIAEQAAFALSSAHAAGIVHRDIKPDNVMIRRDGIVKVLDFGLAKLSEPVSRTKNSLGNISLRRFHTHSGLIMGTPNYMSPEQARGKDIDHQTDIFSLGVVLYEMLSGNLPFSGESVSDIIADVLKKEPARIERIPADLEAIVNKCLQKDKKKRYQTAKALMLDIRDAKQELQIKIRLEQTAEPVHGEKKKTLKPNHQRMRSSDQQPTIILDSDDSKKIRSGYDEKADVTTGFRSYFTDASGSGDGIRRTNDLQNTPTLMLSASEQAIEDFSTANSSRSRLWRERILFTGLMIAIAAAGFWGYRYFTASSRINSIAVLQFVNGTGDANNDYLSDGLSESLMNKLSQLPQLKVTARNSTFKYRGQETNITEIGRALGVEAVVTGRITQSGENLLIGVEMIRAADNTRMWGETYSRKVSVAQNVAQEIAQAVSERLQLQLSGAQEQQLAKRLTDDPQAYQLYMNGIFFRRKNGTENIRKAIEYQNKALALDPNFALAYVELAINYGNLIDIGSMSPKEGLPQAKAAAEKALALDATLADAYYNVARIRKYEFLWTESEQNFKRALEINPNLAGAHTIYAEFLSQVGRFDEALGQIRLAEELDPLRTGLVGNEGSIYYLARRYDEALEKKLLHLQAAPENPFAPLWLADVYVQKGRYAEALPLYNESLKLEETTGAFVRLGRLYALTGKRSEAVAVLEKLTKTEKYVSPAELAILYAALGDTEKAFAMLDQALAEGDIQLTSLKVEPEYDPLRNDQRFKEILKRINLSE